MNETIGSLRAYALKQSRALRVLRSVRHQGQAEAYQDMGSRLIELEQIHEAREQLVEEVMRLALDDEGVINDRVDGSALLLACRKLAEWNP